LKIKELYEKGLLILKNENISDYKLDALILFEELTRFSKNDLLVFPEKEASENEENAFISAVFKRASKTPLQYILGKWDFLGLELYVGEGVLIPRPETEQICEKAASLIKENGKVLDLCAGSGAIGIGICSLRNDVSALCVEYYDEAFFYLEKNIKKYPFSVESKKYDVLSVPDKTFSKCDMIVSNPPYIKSQDIADLQSEVKKEPLTALDGGEDGLIFYRNILKNWKSLLNENGYVVFEIGDEQKEDIFDIFTENGFTDIHVEKDFLGNDRIAYAKLK